MPTINVVIPNIGHQLIDRDGRATREMHAFIRQLVDNIVQALIDAGILDSRISAIESAIAALKSRMDDAPTVVAVTQKAAEEQPDILIHRIVQETIQLEWTRHNAGLLSRVTDLENQVATLT